MSKLDLIDKILEKSKDKLEEAEVYLVENKSLDMELYEGELSKYVISESGGLSLRGIYNGNMGYSYTEKMDESSIDILIERVIENSKYLDENDEEIQTGESNINENKELKLEQINTSDKINLLHELEDKTLELNSDVMVKGVSYNEYQTKRFIKNTKGINASDNSESGAVYISTVVNKDGEVKTGSGYQLFKKFEDINKTKIVKNAIDTAINKLGSKSIKSKDYPVVFENKTFGSLLSAFVSVFSAKSVQDGLSLFEDKINDKVACDIFTLVDDPFLKEGYGSKKFDDEGVKTMYKEVIKNGVLKTYLYNSITAKKDGIESTGNASRSYKGSIGTSHSNLYVLPGDKTEKEILSDIEEGIYIDGLQGLHSGLNAVSGDFSLSAEGYLIKNGSKDRPINQITVAGNLFELLNNIEEIGENLDFGINSGGTIGSPSIKISSLAIAGE